MMKKISGCLNILILICVPSTAHHDEISLINFLGCLLSEFDDAGSMVIEAAVSYISILISLKAFYLR
jgi:hypothetical protein